MKVKQLFLCDIELDKIKEELTGVFANGNETETLKETLCKFNIDMDTDHALTVLEFENFFPCDVCDCWEEIYAGGGCYQCWLSFD